MGMASVVPGKFMRAHILTPYNTYAASGPAKWSVQWLTTWDGRFLIFIFVWQLEHVIGTKVLNSLYLYRWKIIQAQEFLSFWEPSERQPATKNVCKPEAAITVSELVMMSGVSPETCWAIKIHWNNKFYYTVASGWFFLWDLYYDARIREHQTLLFQDLA